MLEGMTELLSFLGGFMILILPGVVGLGTLSPKGPVFERWALGSAIGLAAAVYLSFGASYVRLALFYPAWTILGAAAVISWLKRQPRPCLWARPVGRDWMLVVVLSLVALSRFGVSFFHVLPPGWDPAFHLILAKKLSLGGRMIFDWEPFENIGLNYPLGSHLLVVVLSTISQLPLHTTFSLLIPALGVLTTALIYCFAVRITGREEIAIFSALAYGLWALYGSIDYYRWGGLPNLLAMAFFMACLTLLSGQGPKPAVTTVLLVGLSFTAIFFTHHHVMLVGGFVLAALLVFGVRRRDPRAFTILYGLMASGLLGCFYIVPYAIKATTLGDTQVFKFSEMFYDWNAIVGSLGPVFFVFSVCGLLVHFWVPGKDHQLRILYVVSSSLAGLFVFFEYAYRAISVHLYGESYVAFTPSRFLTDLVYLLSVFAGYAAVQIHRWFRVPLVLVFVGCLALAATNHAIWAYMSRANVLPALIDAYQWIEKNTPPETLVMNDDPWAVYNTWRRCAGTPIPISEPSRDNTRKALLFESLHRGNVPAEEMGSTVVSVRMLGRQPGPTPVLWRHPSGLAVVELWHGQTPASRPATEDVAP